MIDFAGIGGGIQSCPAQDVSYGLFPESATDSLLAGPLPRILFVIPGDGAGATMIFARRLFSAVEASAGAADVFYLMSRASPWKVISEWYRLRKLVHEFAPGIVHAQYGTVTGLLATLCPVPTVITFRGSDLNPSPGRPIRSQLGRMLSKLAAKRAAAVICVSEELRSRLGRSCVAQKTWVLPTGVDTRLFQPMDQNVARQRLGWDPSMPVVLFNGSNPAIKRLDLAQAAVMQAQTVLGQPVRFEVLSGNVNPGLIPIMMNASDCLLLTSDYEGSPTVVQEAAACGLPVVTVDAGDVKTVLAGIHPTRILDRDRVALGNAVAACLRERARSNGPELASRFSLDTVSKEVLRIYQRVARK